MALQVDNITREFIWENKTLTDPNPALLPSEILKVLSREHPLMTSAIIEGPEIKTKDGVKKAVYTISKQAGTLG